MIVKRYKTNLVVFPSSPCGFRGAGLPCARCSPNFYRVAPPDGVRPVEEVVRAVERVIGKSGVESIHLYSGVYAPEDGGIQFLAPYVRALKKHFDKLISVQVHPPQSKEWVDFAYAMGIDAISYNLEIFDANLYRRVFSGRGEELSRERYLQALETAAKIFPQGAVVSDLVLGLESAQSTQAGIDHLASRGVMPTLVALEPWTRKELADLPWPLPEDIESAYAHLHQALKTHRLKPGWIWHFNMSTSFVEEHVFTGDRPRVQSLFERVSKSQGGRILARNISKIRRKIRVKKVADEEVFDL